MQYEFSCIALRRVLTSVSQGLATNTFVMLLQCISDDISTHANFQVDGYHGCGVLLISFPHS